MRRLSSWALPIVLAVMGVVLIIVGSLDLGGTPSNSLPPIRTPTPVAIASPSSGAGGTDGPSLPATPQPTRTPLPDDVTAVQLEIPSISLNVLVRHSTSSATDSFPPHDAAYILSQGNQPGRNRNAYIFAHAERSLFKPLWNVQIGAEVLIRMSDETVLQYVVTEVRPNVACPDPNADPMPDPPLALEIREDCSQGAFWVADTAYERLTLQTSQGFNRNWGELVVIARPTD